jgi:hypothetical protein
MMTKSASWGLGLAVLLAGPAFAVDMRCVDRDGRCMAVTVNGVPAVKLSKATKKLLAATDVRGAEMRHYVGRTRYEVGTPVRGSLEVKADRSADSKGWFGDNRAFEVSVVPLSKVEIETRTEIGAAEGISVGGGTPLTVENVLVGNKLPPGPYLLVVTLRGEENWDRMTLFVRVAE